MRFSRSAAPKGGRRGANAARWNAFRAAAAQATLRKTPTFVACHRVHAKKTTNSFSQENNVDFSEATRAGRRMLAGRTLLKNTKAPQTRTTDARGELPNCRCTSCTDSRAADAQGALDRWGTCAGDRKRPLRTGRTLDGEGSGNSSLGARPREGRRLFHPSIPKIATGERAQGERPAFPKRTMPRRFRLSAGATGATAGPRWRSGPFCAMLRLRRNAARNAEGQPPGRAQTPGALPREPLNEDSGVTACSRSPAPAPATPAPEAADKACSTGRDHGRKQEEISLPARRAFQPCGAVQNALRGNRLPPHGSDLRKGRLHRNRILVPGIVPLVEGQRARMGQKVAHKKSRKPAVLRAPAILSPSFSFFFSLPPLLPDFFPSPRLFRSEASKRL